MANLTNNNSNKGLWGLANLKLPKEPVEVSQYRHKRNRKLYNQRKGDLPTNDPRVRLCRSAQTNANNRGVPFDLHPSDIPTPTHCPALGVRLDYEPSLLGKVPRNAASIDRIVPELGYIPGNIQVLSMQANHLKGNATQKELIAFAKWVLQTY